MDRDDTDLPTLRDFMALMRYEREEERRAVARRLHNEAGQAMALVKMQSYAIEARLRDSDPRLADEFVEAMQILSAAISTVREISENLRPAILQFGIQAAVEWQAQRFEKESKIDCLVHAELDSEFPDPDLTVALFRIFQEALRTVAHHEGASVVHVKLRLEDNEIVMEISDDGRWPHSAEPMPHALALFSIKEQAARAGGAALAASDGIEVRLPVSRIDPEDYPTGRSELPG